MTLDANQPMKEDFLKELANIGIGHAASSLSSMVNAKVDISLPDVGIVPIDKVANANANRFCAVILGLQGDLIGNLFTLFSDKTSFWLIDKMMGSPEGTTQDFNDDGKAAMAEFANIIGGAFLTSLSNFSHFNMLPKIPETKLGNATEIREIFNYAIRREIERALYARTEMTIDGKKVDGEIYLILDDKSFDKMFQSMQ